MCVQRAVPFLFFFYNPLRTLVFSSYTVIIIIRLMTGYRVALPRRGKGRNKKCLPFRRAAIMDLLIGSLVFRGYQKGWLNTRCIHLADCVQVLMHRCVIVSYDFLFRLFRPTMFCTYIFHKLISIFKGERRNGGRNGWNDVARKLIV